MSAVTCFPCLRLITITTITMAAMAAIISSTKAITKPMMRRFDDSISTGPPVAPVVSPIGSGTLPVGNGSPEGEGKGRTPPSLVEGPVGGTEGDGVGAGVGERVVETRAAIVLVITTGVVDDGHSVIAAKKKRKNITASTN